MGVKMQKSKLQTIVSSAVAVFVALILAVSFSLTLSGCGEKELSQNAQSFVNFVIRIKTPITLDSESEIEAGYILYEHLNDADKKNATVKEKKTVLDEYKSEYDALRAAQDELDLQEQQAALRARFESAVDRLPSADRLTADNRADIDGALALYAQLNDDSKAVASVQQAYVHLLEAEGRVAFIEYTERLAEVAAAAEEFIDGVNALGEITLESIDAIEDLLYAYDNFAQDIKDFEGVTEAKALLDAAAAEYTVLKDDDDIASFNALAAELSPVATAVTLDSQRTIEKAEALYLNMSERAKAGAGVAQAYETVLAARARYDELFAIAENERISAFIAAANAVPTDIENVDITWFDVLDAAGNAYFALAYESQLLPEVEAAFKRWDAAQMAFDKMGFERVPMVDPNLLFSGDVPPHLVLQLEENMFAPVRDFYGVASNAELDKYVTVWLNIYVDGVYQGRGQLSFSELGHIIVNSRLVSVLKELSATNDKIVSGANFSFSMNFEDKEGKYIPSKKTKLSPSKNTYTW